MAIRLKHFLQQTSVWQALEWINIGVALLTVIKVLAYYVESMSYPYQLEYREGALLSLIPAMQAGLIPLSEAQTPDTLYVYGPGYPYLVLWLSEFTGHPLIAGRLLSMVFNGFTSGLLFYVMVRRQVPLIFAFQVVTVFFVFMAKSAALMFPSAPAAFFLTLSVFIPWRFSGNFWACLTGVLVSLIGFTFKQYAIIGIPAIVVFYVGTNGFSVRSWFRSVWLVLLVPVIPGALFTVFPSYYTVAFRLFQCYQSASLEHMLQQLVYFFSQNLLHFGLLILLLWQFVALLFKGLNQPIYALFSWDWKILASNILLFQLVVSALLFIGKMGLHTGSDKAFYLYHILAFFMLAHWVPLLYHKLKLHPWQPLRLLMLVLPLWTLSVGIGLYTDFLFTRYVKNEDFYQATEVYFKESNKIYASPEMASLSFDHGIKIWNNGCSEYALDLFECGNIEKTPFAQKVLDYQQDISNQVAAQDFDYVFFEKNYYGKNVLNPDTLNKYYSEETYFLRGENPDTTFLFKPRNTAALIDMAQ